MRMGSSDTEKKSLTTLHIAARRALQKVLSRVETEEKIEIKQALYHLDKALKQENAKSPIEIQLKQLNTKMGLLLCKQDSNFIITQKIADKAEELVQEQAQRQESSKAATTETVQKQSTKTNITNFT